MGPVPPKDQVDTWLVNATQAKHHAGSKGGRLFHPRRQLRHDSRRASRSLRARRPMRSPRTATSPIGRPHRTTLCPRSAGAMDLSAGSKRLWVLMEHHHQGRAARAFVRAAPIRSRAACVGEACLHQSCGDRCDGARLRSARHGRRGGRRWNRCRPAPTAKLRMAG